ncbi:serine hydrolase domain-containing protein [Rhodococcus olei]|uniref:Serine hydrolase domain-containing protein n=1 Tax=Rhodococcus olei TaxID=2161675 RepID=A0ABP8P0C7_9NOCA
MALSLLAAACSDSGSESGSTTTSSAVTPVDQATMQSALESGAKEFLLPGAVALLRTPTGTVTATYGTTERGGGAPVTVGDHVRVGSNTKTWTSTVILQQAQEGKIALTDPVSKYRPDVPNGANITVEQLLNMRSGLFNYTETPELNSAMDTDPGRVWTPDQLLALAYPHPPYFPPGQGYHYSNTNYVLLGLIAEQLDAKPLPQIYRDRLFGPVGLTSTMFPDLADSGLPAPNSHGYFYGTNMLTIDNPALPADMQAAARNGTLAPADVTFDNPSWAWAAGSGISTADDLATWVEALTDGKVLSADMQQKRMASPEPTDPNNPSAAGYGWGIAKFGPMYGHTGELPGYNSFMGSDPVNHVTLVVWANLAPGVDGRDPASTIAKNLIGQMYPQ